MGRSAILSAGAVLVVGIGLPLLAGVRAQDSGLPVQMLAAVLLGATLAISRRWLGPSLPLGGHRPSAVDGAALGPSVDQACRQERARLRSRGVRLVSHVRAAAANIHLTATQQTGLLASLHAASHLLGDAPTVPTPVRDGESVLRLDLDRLEGETGSHLRLRLSGGPRSPEPRCARRLRQLSARLGAQLDIVEHGGMLEVELVLALPASPA